MGKSSAAGKTQVAEYRMSIHMGVCGTVDALTAIYVGEKLAWEGEVSAQTPIPINAPDFFGGVKKEGGLQGTAWWLPGDSTQVLPDNLAARFGKTGATMPGFRGLASIFFAGNGGEIVTGNPDIGEDMIFPGAGLSGFMWGANNPYLKSVWARVRRRPVGLATQTAMIGPDANPVHMIYECLTNTDWGMGAPPGVLDTGKWTAAAQTLLAENFGMSIKWMRQTKIEAFVTEILDHIQATLFVNPQNGRLTIKLIRDDYNVNDLYELNPDNCEVVKFDRKSFGETVNEIVVTWTNPENEQEETVTAQDLANIAVQGGIVSDSRNYYGVRNRDLAMALAQRDLRTAAYPMATFEIQVDRSGWNLLPGDVVRLNYPEKGISGLVLRLVEVDYGRVGSPAVRIVGVEDVFALARGAYVTPPSTQFPGASENPEPLRRTKLLTVPYHFAQQIGVDSSLEYPEVVSLIAGVQTSSRDTLGFEVMAEVVQPNGSTVWENVGSFPIGGYTTLGSPLAAEATTLVPSFGPITGVVPPAVSRFVLFGAGGDGDTEIALITTAGTGGWTLARGVLDTVPRAWAPGTQVWFLDLSRRLLDQTVRSAMETARYRLLTRTSRGLLGLAQAPTQELLLGERPYLPYRPANVRVNGVGFGTVTVTSSATVTVTWANRNRLTEPNAVLRWTDGSVSPEQGQTTTIRLIKPGGPVIHEATGLTGTSHDISASLLGSETEALVQVVAVRDGHESLQGHSILLRRATAGYGLNYGNEYGGPL